jgi:hypothetical protein
MRKLVGMVYSNNNKNWTLPDIQVSLNDRLVGIDGEDDELQIMIQDDRVDIFKEYEKKEIIDTITKAVAKLNQKEQLVLKKIYYEEMTRPQICSEGYFEDVKQLKKYEYSAMAKLRKMPEVQNLKSIYIPPLPTEKTEIVTAVIMNETWDNWLTGVVSCTERIMI